MFATVMYLCLHMLLAFFLQCLKISFHSRADFNSEVIIKLEVRVKRVLAQYVSPQHVFRFNVFSPLQVKEITLIMH